MEQTGACLNGCQRYEKKTILQEIMKKIRSLVFICRYKVNGCDEHIEYENVVKHEENCDYQLITCVSHDCSVKTLMS